MDPGLVHRAFLAGTAGLCLFLGVAFRTPGLVAFAVCALLLVLLTRRQARRRLARLTAHRRLAPGAFEGEEVRVEVALENHGATPVSLVEIVDSFGASLAERKAVLDPGPLPPGRRHRLSYRTHCTRLWGVHTVGPLALSVSDALGLHSPRRLVPDIQPFDLFPRVHPVGGLEHLGARSSFAPSEPTAPRAGQSASYLGVRDFRPGDDLRRLHWPATARHGTPMVKEFELDLVPHFTLFLDLEAAHRAGTGRKSTREYVVRTAACLLASAARRGDTVQLRGEGRDPLLVPPGRGELHLAFALDQLIRVRQDGAVPLVDLAARDEVAVPPGSTAALLAASLFLDLEGLAEVFDRFRARRVRPALVAIDMDSFLPIDRRSRPREQVNARAEELRDLARAHGALFARLDAERHLEEELQRPDWLEAP